MPAYAAVNGCCLDLDSNRAAHAGAAEAAVAVRILREVLLMIVLGVVELGCRDDLGRNRAVPGFRDRALILVARTFRGVLLLLVEVVDARSILRADVVPLPHPLRRIVGLPERLQQIVVRDASGIKDDEYDFRVTRHGAADLAVRGVRRRPGGVADGGREHARQLPELPLSAPETSKAEERLLIAGGKRAFEGGSEDVMSGWNGHPLGAPLERLGGRRQLQLVVCEHRRLITTPDAKAGLAGGSVIAALRQQQDQQDDDNPDDQEEHLPEALRILARDSAGDAVRDDLEHARA